jgi:hypothetical protein
LSVLTEEPSTVKLLSRAGKSARPPPGWRTGTLKRTSPAAKRSRCSRATGAPVVASV